MKFWLIQRGHFNELSDTIDGLTGRNGLVRLDYMGSAEFEFGAIPGSYRRIMGNYSNYKLIQTSHKDKNKNPIWIFCDSEKEHEVKDSLSEFIKNPYRLKEYSGLEPWITPDRANFWWEIERGIDFMFFYGDEEVANKFSETVANDYNEWWMKKDKNTREAELKKASGSYY